MTRSRSLLVLSLTAVLTAAVAGPVAAQSSSAPAEPPASVPAGPAITVIATDYHFAGLPTTVPVGTTLTLDNQGTELHELIIVRKNDGVTKTWNELLAMPNDEAFQYVTMLSEMPLFALPGQTAEGTIVITQAGEYFAVCFVPQGTTEMPDMSTSPDPSATMDPSASQGPPHFLLGMRQDFLATAAGTAVGPLPSASAEMPTESTAP